MFLECCAHHDGPTVIAAGSAKQRGRSNSNFSEISMDPSRATQRETFSKQVSPPDQDHMAGAEKSDDPTATHGKDFGNLLAKQLMDLHEIIMQMHSHAADEAGIKAGADGSVKYFREALQSLQPYHKSRWHLQKRQQVSHPGDDPLLLSADASASLSPAPAQEARGLSPLSDETPVVEGHVPSQGAVAPAMLSPMSQDQPQGRKSWRNGTGGSKAKVKKVLSSPVTSPVTSPKKLSPKLAEDAKKAKILSRQASRIDDFDDIVNDGFKQFRRKQTGMADDMRLSAMEISRKRRLAFNHLLLEPAICMVLVVNSILIGVNMDYPDWGGWSYVDVGFLLIYVAELVIKLKLLGCRTFFSRPQLWFNLFDVAIVVIATFGSILQIISDASGGGELHQSIVVVRLVRLARVARIIRLFRFSFFKELLVMIACLVSGLRTLMWAFILLLFAIYPMSLVLTQFVGQVEDKTELKEMFESVPRSMLTVFRCVIGDCNYRDGTPAILDLVDRYGLIWIPMYVTVMLIITFGLFNLIMAIFVDNALSDAKRQERGEKLRRLRDRDLQKEQTAAMLERLLVYVEEDKLKTVNLNSGDMQELEPGLSTEGLTGPSGNPKHLSVTKTTFERFLRDEKVIKILESLDVPEEERLDLFEVLDANGNGSLQMDELINGVIKLRGDPRRSDVVHVLLVLRSLQEEMQDFRDYVQSSLQEEVPQMSTAVSSPRQHAPRISEARSAASLVKLPEDSTEEAL